MHLNSQVQASGDEGSKETNADRDNGRHAAELRPLKGVIDNAAVGVALFDRHLRCRALNAVLRAMGIVSPGEYTGRSIQQVFGGAGQELEPGFQRVLDTRHNFTDFQLAAQSSLAKGARRWSINFYPIKDESHQVWLVAATFSELTKRNRATPTQRGVGLHRNNRDTEPSLLGEEISELLAQSLKLAPSVEHKDNSVSMRSYVSETRAESGLESLHLFLTLPRARQSLTLPPLPQTGGGADVPESTASCQSHQPLDGGPSRRERQVLNFLAAGKSNKEIGAILEISTRTVETYRARLMKKLKLHSTAELVRYAVRNKIIEA